MLVFSWLIYMLFSRLVFPPDCQKGQGKLKKGQGILVAEGHSKILIQMRRSLHINIKHIIQILYFCVKAALYLWGCSILVLDKSYCILVAVFMVKKVITLIDFCMFTITAVQLLPLTAWAIHPPFHDLTILIMYKMLYPWRLSDCLLPSWLPFPYLNSCAGKLVNCMQ